MKRIFMLSALVALLSGCKGGGVGGGSSYEPSPAQKAAIETFQTKFADFLTDSNATGKYSLTKLKSATDHGFWWVVVYDQLTDKSFAVNLQNYDPSGDVNEFFSNRSNFFNDLTAIAGHYEYSSSWDTVCSCYELEETWISTKYMHPSTGILFEKTTSSPKDLETMAAFREDFELQQTAESMQLRLGLSVERSQEVAHLVKAWSKSGGREMTPSEKDRFSEELLGFKIGEAERILKNASTASEVKAEIDDLVSKAAEQNETSPEQIRQMVDIILQE